MTTVDIVLHMCKLSWSLVLTYFSLGIATLYINVLPAAIRCCLQTCYIDVMLLLIDLGLGIIIRTRVVSNVSVFSRRPSSGK